MAKLLNGKPSAGHYYAVKYLGDNGDLILGKVESVRTTGEVILTNLLTENRSVKATKILLGRNHRISKREADTLLALYKKTKNVQTVRKAAVALWVAKQAPVVKKPIKDLNKKLIDEQGNVVGTLAQSRQTHSHHGKPIEQVFSEIASLDLIFSDRKALILHIKKLNRELTEAIDSL